MPLFRLNIRHNVRTLSRQGPLWDLRVIKPPSKSHKKEPEHCNPDSVYPRSDVACRSAMHCSLRDSSTKKFFALDVWRVTYQTRYLDS